MFADEALQPCQLPDCMAILDARIPSEDQQHEAGMTQLQSQLKRKPKVRGANESAVVKHAKRLQTVLA